MYKSFLKPLFDRLAALVILVLTSPVWILCLLVLSIANNGSVFFKQKRPGLKGKIFLIVKFKTMNDRRDANGNLLSDDKRLTKVGVVIRKLSIDELPQLFNVLKGQMSIVGPRPLLPEYLPLYNNYQARRHDVKPGITGWAQVNGRNAISWQDKFNYDIYYVDNLSFLFDCKIVIKTMLKLFTTDGITDGVNRTAEKFKGN